MKIFAVYLRDHTKSICLCLAFLLLNLLMIHLYHAPIEMGVYWVALCFFLGAICMTADFFRYRSHHLQLVQMQREILVSMDNLPEPKGLAEADYCELLGVMNEALIELRTVSGKSEQDMLDYYTLWVHQIKTPIAAMRLILQEEENDSNKELLLQLFKIEQYVELVLQYLRMESTATDYTFRMQELDDIVRQAVRKYAPLFIRKKLTLHYEPLNCRVLTDEKWLCFVVEQILSNSLKYTNEGSISIYMDARAEKMLVIEDTGIGIAKEDLPRIGEKSYTGYNGRKDKKASGLGLYLCRTILKKLGHRLTIESEAGKGTRVIIDLVTTHVEHE